MRIERHYTAQRHAPYDSARFAPRENAAGRTVTMPAHWSDVACAWAADNLFYRGPLPPVSHDIPAHLPAWLTPHRNGRDESGLRYEDDIRMVIDRIAGCAAVVGIEGGVFDGEDDARAFYDELRYVLLHRIAVPEKELWQKSGLTFAYGIDTERPSPRHRVAPAADTRKRLGKYLRLLACAADCEDGEPSPVMVTAPAAHGDIEALIGWKQGVEQSLIARQAGMRLLDAHLNRIMDSCNRDRMRGFDPSFNAALGEAVEDARRAGVPESAVRAALMLARQGYENMPLAEDVLPDPDVADIHADPAGADCVHTGVRLPHALVEAALTGHGWRPDSNTEQVDARALWDDIAEAAWTVSEPAVVFDDTLRGWLPRGRDGGCIGIDSCGAFTGAPGSVACGASLVLDRFSTDGVFFDGGGFAHCCRIVTIALDLLSDDAGIADPMRPLALSHAGMAGLLMGKGIAYDSDDGRAFAAAVSALMTASATVASAEMAETCGAFERWDDVAKDMFRVLHNHRRAAEGETTGYDGLPSAPYLPRGAHEGIEDIRAAAAVVWKAAMLKARDHGLRNAWLTMVGDDDAAAAIGGGVTRALDPVTELVRFEGWHGEDAQTIYGRKLCPVVQPALAALGYTAQQIDDIGIYATGNGTLLDAPGVNHDELRQRGFTEDALARLERALPGMEDIRHAFSPWTLGRDFCANTLAIEPEDLNAPGFDMLSALGFSEDDIDDANLYCCGASGLEGAPHLDPRHLHVFDCLTPAGGFSVRRVDAAARLHMMAAVQPHVSGGISHMLTLPRHATVDEVRGLFRLAWEKGLKSLRLYREGCSLLDPAAFLPGDAPATRAFAPLPTAANTYGLSGRSGQVKEEVTS